MRLCQAMLREIQKSIAESSMRKLQILTGLLKCWLGESTRDDLDQTLT